LLETYSFEIEIEEGLLKLMKPNLYSFIINLFESIVPINMESSEASKLYPYAACCCCVNSVQVSLRFKDTFLYRVVH